MRQRQMSSLGMLGGLEAQAGRPKIILDGYLKRLRLRLPGRVEQIGRERMLDGMHEEMGLRRNLGSCFDPAETRPVCVKHGRTVVVGG